MAAGLVTVALAVFAVMGAAARTTRGQSPPKQRPSPERPPAPGGGGRNKKADGQPNAPARLISVLTGVADEAKIWEDSVAASNVLAEVADLIWESEPDKALTYLEQAWAAASRIADLKQEKSPFRNSSARLTARAHVLLVARARAPEKAGEWVEAIAREADVPETRHRGSFDDRTARSTVLLQLAMSALQVDDLQAASRLAIDSVQDGISYGLQDVLIKLQEKDFDVARGVFHAALSRLKAQGLTDPNELLTLHAYLYTPGRAFSVGASDERNMSLMSVSVEETAVTPAAELDSKMAAKFLRIAGQLLVDAPFPSTTADPLTAARRQIGVINIIQSAVANQFPDLGIALRHRAQQIEQDARFSPGRRGLPAGMPAPGTGENRKDYADRYQRRLEDQARRETDPIGRDIAFARAALEAGFEQSERSLSLAGNVRDNSLRQNVTNWLMSRATLEYLKLGEADKAYELIGRNEDPQHQAVCLVIGAQHLVKAKKVERAAEWLREARTLMKRIPTDETSSRIALGIASTYAEFEWTSALDALAEAVKIMNQSPGASAADERAPIVRRFAGITTGDLNYGTRGFGIRAAAAAFRLEQFEDVLGVLDGIKRVETRGLAKVSLCRGSLRRRGGPHQATSNEP